MNHFQEYVTTHYKLNCYRSLTNKYVVLTTRVDNLNYNDMIKQFYTLLYVETLQRNLLVAKHLSYHNDNYSVKLRDFFEKYTQSIRRL